MQVRETPVTNSLLAAKVITQESIISCLHKLLRIHLTISYKPRTLPTQVALRALLKHLRVLECQERFKRPTCRTPEWTDMEVVVPRAHHLTRIQNTHRCAKNSCHTSNRMSQLTSSMVAAILPPALQDSNRSNWTQIYRQKRATYRVHLFRKRLLTINNTIKTQISQEVARIQTRRISNKWCLNLHMLQLQLKCNNKHWYRRSADNLIDEIWRELSQIKAIKLGKSD